MSADHQFAPPELEELAKLLPAYHITAFIAKGGMGAVYRASQRSLDREVAIKILPMEFGEEAEFRKQFEAEAKAMAKLNHPNLVGVYDFGEVEGMLYIVMEYIPGKSLYYSIYKKAIEQKEAARLVLGICEGLAHAHEAGILHRDIKPSNILLGLKARPKIGDFGLASQVEGSDGGELAFGTPDYAAPELIQAGSNFSKRSDVFATGVILYEALTGKIPGNKYIPASQMAKVDPRFDRIIRRATHPTPSLRFADAAEMGKELQKLVDILSKTSSSSLVTTGNGGSAPNKLALAANPDGTSVPHSPAPAPAVAAPIAPNFSLIRNMVIILLLLLAIWGMWGAYKAQTASNIQKQEEFELEQAEKKATEAAKREAERIARLGKGKGTAGNTPKLPRPTPPKPRTPMEVLEDLKGGLFAGDRSEFPPGTEERGTKRFFYVNTPMNWQQAATFSEEHGGHLATCPTDPDSNWLSSKIKGDAGIWLGGGAIGRNDWGWVDGRKWTHRKPGIASGTSATMSPLGTIKARPPGQSMPFFIQWHMDGNNPGSLNAQLKRTSESLATPNPVYPPGTFTLGSRRYLLIALPSTWSDASHLAQTANGHLAVPSDQAEIEYLKTLVDKSLPAGEAVWLGGTHNGNAWRWTTGEPWAAADWTEGSPDGNASSASALRIIAGPSGGWDDANPNKKSSTAALLIEWSKDSEKEVPVGVPTASGELSRLRKKGSDAISAKGTEYQKSLKENAKAFIWDLDFSLRGLRHSAQAAYKPGVVTLKESIRDDGTIPNNISRAGIPRNAAKILDGYLQTQNRIHSKFMIDIDRLRISYVKLLKKSRKTLEEKGLKAQVQAIDNEINACGNDASTLLLHFTGDEPGDPGS